MTNHVRSRIVNGKIIFHVRTLETDSFCHKVELFCHKHDCSLIALWKKMA